MVRVGEKDRAELEDLVDAYLVELATYRDRPVGATNAADYAYLPLYWSEPGRHAFFFDTEHSRAGFALIREVRDEGVIQMSEFYVRPPCRRRGVGRAAVEAIWARFPGSWELQVHVRNQVASAFWLGCIQALATGPIRATEVVEEDGRRTQYGFEIGAGGG